MDLWGVEIKPGAPYVLQLDKTRGKLHISQATLGVGSSSKVSLLQGVAGKKPILSCCLSPDKTHPLNLEFEKEEDVIFSVSGGPQSVHLDGYYLGSTFAHGDGDERNVEINADEHTNGKKKKKKNNNNKTPESNKNTDGEETKKGDSYGENIGESENEQSTDKKASKESKGKAEDDGDQVRPISCPSKRKRQDDQDGKAERVLKKTKDSSLPTSEIEQESAQQQKKKKRKERVKEGKTHGVGNDSMVEADKAKTDDTTQDEPAENTKPSNDKSVEINADENPTGMKKKKKKNKTPESNKNEDGEETKKGSIVQIEDKKAEVKPTRERKYADGLVVEELKMGRQNGKRAFPGTRVSVRYTVNLKENGEIVESKYLVFLLGVGKVIKGLDVGLNGMLVGGKRKLTTPPSMGFKERVNDWLDMDIELLDVR